jgi:3-oxoacyl-[acyl-carrier protein] reductase
MEPVQEWADVADLSLETYDAITQQAAKMPFFVLQQAALRVCTDGRLLLVMPDATLPAGFTGAAHAGAGAAAAVYLRVLAREVGSRGITVNAISRKPHEYTTGHASQPSTSADARVDRDRDHGMSGDIAALTAFLAGPDARWINGQILHVDSVRPA